MADETHFDNEQYTPTAITAANPVRVTIANHGFLPGQALRATKFYQYPLADSPGMEQLNNRIFYVQLVTTNDFALFDEFGHGIDGTGYTAFVNNGKSQFTRTGPKLYVENHITGPDSQSGIPVN